MNTAKKAPVGQAAMPTQTTQASATGSSIAYSADHLANQFLIAMPHMADPSRRVLGVIRPTTEIIGQITKTGRIGVLGTRGTVTSNSYPIEIEKFWPALKVYQQACPMWVPLVENNEYDKPGADYFIQQHLNRLFQQSPTIDTLLLACTHYPLLIEKIRQFSPEGTTILAQGSIVAESLKAYLQRHPEMEERCSKNGSRTFFTTDSVIDFDNHASIFFGEKLSSRHLELL